MLERPSILIVDDDEDIRTVFKLNLERVGYFVETAERGKEAIEKSKERHFNLALIDIKLPDMEGTQLLKTLGESFPNMIRIVVTGYPTLKNAIECLNEGADGYVLKPVDMDKVLKMIEERLKRQREELRYTERKVEEFIEARARELESLMKYHKPI
ncbi:MAG: response regulator [Candidatus Bathyarchaeia archaeon]